MAVDYDTAKRLAASQDDTERRFVAGQAETRPEILYLLASDSSAEVRREIARNASTPRHADLMLSTDPDEGVRSGLAGKIAALVPTLPPDRVGQIERMTLEILGTLARDQAVAVRRVVADALKDQPNAPPGIVQQLARDLELSVSGPVLRYSPILSDEDLLQIIQAAPLDGHLVAIAERAGVSPGVSDAVARTESEAAVAALLGNASAQIREETLDRLLEMAPRHEPWHGPLVRRPNLPAKAAARIAGFVADQLLKVLKARKDLSPETLAAVTQAVKARVAGAATIVATPNAKPEQAAESPKERPSDRATRLHAEGKLDEETVSDALATGDRGFVLAALALLAGTTVEVVDTIASGQSPRGITALCWKAGLGMRTCRQVQVRLAMIPPKQVLMPKDGTEYPMTVADMEWQLDFFGIKPTGKPGRGRKR